MVARYVGYHAARLLVFAAITPRNTGRRQKPRRSEGREKGAGQRLFLCQSEAAKRGPGVSPGAHLASPTGALSSFLMDEWAHMPDMLTTKQATELTDYNDTTINNWVADGKIQAVNYYGKNLISKESLTEHLASCKGQRIARPPQKHREIMEAFIDREQKSGMVFGSMSL